MIRTLAIGLLALGTAAAAHGPENLAASELEWVEIIPGVDFAPAFGDWAKEGHGKFVRLAPGASVPMHTHSGSYEGVFVSGEMVNILDGGTRVAVGPGHYFQMAGGRLHGHECVSEVPCFFYTHSPAAWDIQVPE
ncbi:cupin domain-containing protein [Sphingomicrobium nitratireducens]|uniref:cupin domain-containing protein n=1 Tax=Sphingomicrobium nitratireducens TaxID=2964666 RepID=UPI002240196C|nr:cupin domain-containing protein [Sphingomicrobium nitratireducens]